MELEGESRAPLNDRDLVEAVVCLANGSGGTLLVGVEDDGTVTGARPRHEAGRTDPLWVQALVANSTQPPLAVTAAVVQVRGQEVLVVEVPDSPGRGHDAGHLRAAGSGRRRKPRVPSLPRARDARP